VHLDLISISLYALTFVVCGAALWKGEAAERWAGGLNMGMFLVGMLAARLNIGEFGLLELVGDGLTALGFLILTVTYGRLWLGLAMLFQAAQFTLHSYYLVLERKHDVLHAVVNDVDFFGILLSLAVGTALTIRRRQKTRRDAAAAGSAA